MRLIRLAFYVAAVALFVQGAEAQPHNLALEQRIRAQEAIERARYAHQIGASRPFEEAVPRAVLEKKVRTYLKESVALEVFWKTPVTSEMLRRELERMAVKTRMPGRLRELYTVLGNDPLVIQESLARPALVDRLARNFFASDATIHANARREAEALREDLARGRLNPRSEHPRRRVVEMVRGDAVESTQGSRKREHRLELQPAAFDRYRARLPARVGEIGPVQDEREAFITRVVLDQTESEFTVAAFVVPKLSWDEWWASVAGRLEESSVDAVAPAESSLPIPTSDRSEVPSGETCLADDDWDNGSLDDFPDPRSGHTAVWTGGLMIVWGGSNGSVVNSGGRYDPATDTWTPTSTTNAPSARSGHTAVWKGSLMVVWGGGSSSTYLDTGGRYDPATDTWTPTSMTNAPSARTGHTAVWTGSLMVVWGGGSSSTYLDTGGRYDPATDTWTPTSATNSPSARTGHTAVWTGSLMVVWGGFSGQYFDTGGRYDPASDTWIPTSTTDAPLSRNLHTAVWTGSLMVVWGGYDGGPNPVGSGGRYDPAGDAWTPMSTTNAPQGAYEHTAVWTGSLMIVWGGVGSSSTGGRYSPATDTWTPTSTTTSTINVPSGRSSHSAIWTGNLMIVWGGTSYDSYTENTGGLYDPATDIWSATATMNAPTGRTGHSAVWTGNLMLVWGGYDGGVSYSRTGGRYDPAADAWSPTSTINAPSDRGAHTAVWTGSLMVVWGGYTGSFPVSYLNDGGRYDPATDTWIPTSTTNAPSGRADHRAVWTGSLVVVWGGSSNSSPFIHDTGGRYNPASDTWTPISGINAPSGRYSHAAVWTGSRMVVWGGYGYYFPLFGHTGGQYDPVADTWTATSTSNAPSARYGHTAVWTGELMVVWGGRDTYSSGFNTGGRYDPTTDRWTRTSLVNVPTARFGHTAVWTGSLMMVWGGGLDTGGRYAPGQAANAVDVDQDGFSECQGDCDDGNAGLYPGARELCDEMDNDCDGIVDAIATWCGVGECSRSGFCTAGVDTCVPGSPSVEVCDGLDNNCDGGVDNASIPAGSPSVALNLSGPSAVLEWEPLPGATGYDVVQGDLGTLLGGGGDFTPAIQGCPADDFGNNTLVLGAQPPAQGTGFFYLVRGMNCGGSGTYDSEDPAQVGSRDAGIDASPLSCGPPVCGNGVCDSNEDCHSCIEDCSDLCCVFPELC